MKYFWATLNFLAAIFVVLIIIEFGSAFWFFVSSQNQGGKKAIGHRTPLLDISDQNHISRFRKSELHRKRMEYFVPDPVLGIRFQANGEVFAVVPDGEGEAVYSTNGILTDKYGLISNSSEVSEREYNLAQIISDPSIYRIIVSGSSSSVWGASENRKTWPSHLNRLLNEDTKLLKSLGYSRVFVFNTGTFSHTVAQEILRLATETSYWRPNMVISFNGPAQSELEYTGNAFDFSIHWALKRMISRSRIDSIFMPLNVLPYTSIFLTNLIRGVQGYALGYRQQGYPIRSYDQLYMSKIRQMEAVSNSVGAEFLWILAPILGICPEEDLLPNEAITREFFEKRFGGSIGRNIYRSQRMPTNH
ncbi:MAG: hypothetical protein IPJ71_18040 [Bdellovibrionales bacterium]|nr:hypothetical protein [Bdellovibrionales bacterium]